MCTIVVMTERIAAILVFACGFLLYLQSIWSHVRFRIRLHAALWPGDAFRSSSLNENELLSAAKYFREKADGPGVEPPTVRRAPGAEP